MPLIAPRNYLKGHFLTSLRLVHRPKLAGISMYIASRRHVRTWLGRKPRVDQAIAASVSLVHTRLPAGASSDTFCGPSNWKGTSFVPWKSFRSFPPMNSDLEGLYATGGWIARCLFFLSGDTRGIWHFVEKFVVILMVKRFFCRELDYLDLFFIVNGC